MIYAPAILALLRTVEVRAVAHITGGGLPGNLSRVLPRGRRRWSSAGAGSRPASSARSSASVASTTEELAKVFNLGIGMVVVVPADEVYRALDVLRTQGSKAVEIGRIEQRRRRRPPGLTGRPPGPWVGRGGRRTRCSPARHRTWRGGRG